MQNKDPRDLLHTWRNACLQAPRPIIFGPNVRSLACGNRARRVLPCLLRRYGVLSLASVSLSGGFCNVGGVQGGQTVQLKS